MVRLLLCAASFLTATTHVVLADDLGPAARHWLMEQKEVHKRVQTAAIVKDRAALDYVERRHQQVVDKMPDEVRRAGPGCAAYSRALDRLIDMVRRGEPWQTSNEAALDASDDCAELIMGTRPQRSDAGSS